MPICKFLYLLLTRIFKVNAINIMKWKFLDPASRNTHSSRGLLSNVCNRSHCRQQIGEPPIKLCFVFMEVLQLIGKTFVFLCFLRVVLRNSNIINKLKSFCLHLLVHFRFFILEIFYNCLHVAIFIDFSV